jgi:hypothetical protein
MRKRVLLIAAPLLVVALAASVAVAAPSDAEHSRGPKLDKLHAERPIAASTRLHTETADETRQAALAQKFYTAYNLDKFYTAYNADKFFTAYLADKFFSAVLASQQAELSAQTRQSAPSRTVSSNSNPGDFLSCVRQRESGGNYGIYNAGGSGAAGAYQFLPGTWNSIAASSGRGDLVGMDPAQASPGDQDAMAQALYAQQGSAPWGGGC